MNIIFKDISITENTRPGERNATVEILLGDDGPAPRFNFKVEFFMDDLNGPDLPKRMKRDALNLMRNACQSLPGE